MNWLPQSASTFAPGVDLILWLVTIISVLSCVLIGFLLVSSFVVTISADEGVEVESVTIIGTKDDVKDLAGSGAVISNDDLEKAMDTDIQKILTAVPGVYMRTEEGYGLRPNISIRGTAIERSGKVTIMEDGVLVAPSPYTSSSAYYFPTTGRIHAVEVLKGPAVVSQGPQTIGGAINLISTPTVSYTHLRAHET